MPHTTVRKLTARRFDEHAAMSSRNVRMPVSSLDSRVHQALDGIRQSGQRGRDGGTRDAKSAV